MVSWRSWLVLVAWLVGLNASGRAEPPVLTDRWGDALPAGALARMGTTRFRHAGPIQFLAYSPDGKTLASGSWGASLDYCLWDATTGKELRRSRVGKGGISQAVLSPDGKILASHNTTAIHLDEAATGKELRQWAPADAFPIESLTFSPDGKVLASVGRGAQAIRLWEVTTAKELCQVRQQVHSLCGVAFSPDSRTLAATLSVEINEMRICLWDATTGEELRRFKGHRGIFRSVIFSPDGKTLASGGLDQTLGLWNVSTGQELRQLGDRDGSIPAAFSPDGKILASLSPAGVTLWDMATGKRLRQLPVNPRCVAFSPDGRTLASGGAEGNTIRLWEVATGKELSPATGHHGAITAIALSPDTQIVASASEDRTIRLWETATGKELRRLRGQDSYTLDLLEFKMRQVLEDVVESLAFSPDGKTLASGDRGTNIGLWDVATAKQLHYFPYGLMFFGVQQDLHVVVAFSPDGKTLASGSGRGTISLWEPATGKHLRQFGAIGAPVSWITFSTDGATLATGFDHNFGGQPNRLWDPVTGKELRRFPSGDKSAPSWEAKQLVMGGPLWSAVTGKRFRQLAGDGFALSPDGKTLAKGNNQDLAIELWELATGQLRHQLRGHLAPIRSLAFSSDGCTLVSGSEDATVLIWDVIGLNREERTPPASISAQELETLWSDLAAADAPKAYRAVCKLAALPKQATPWLREHLRSLPLTTTRGPQQIGQWIADLDHDDFAVREKATAELAKWGDWAEPALRQTLASQTSPEVHSRVEHLLEKLKNRPELVTPPEWLRALRALEVLERINTPATRQVFEMLANGPPNAWLTQEAQAARERLAKRLAAAP